MLNPKKQSYLPDFITITVNLDFPKQKLENSSRVRDHLANERTYLAWMRTAVALIGCGILIGRLRYLLAPNLSGIGLGIIVILLTIPQPKA